MIYLIFSASTTIHPLKMEPFIYISFFVQYVCRAFETAKRSGPVGCYQPDHLMILKNSRSSILPEIAPDLKYLMGL